MTGEVLQAGAVCPCCCRKCGQECSKGPTPCLQDLPKNSLDLLEGVFLFSLVWSIGATVDKDGRGAFNRFLRKMLHKGVSITPDRSDFDLGPGLTIQEPEWSISVPMPTVSRRGQQCS